MSRPLDRFKAVFNQLDQHHLDLDDGRVHDHRDYFDMGEFIYEQAPILGSVIRAIKKRL